MYCVRFHQITEIVSGLTRLSQLSANRISLFDISDVVELQLVSSASEAQPTEPMSLFDPNDIQYLSIYFSPVHLAWTDLPPRTLNNNM